MPKPSYDGVIASVPVPMSADMEIDLAALRSYLAWLEPQGVTGVVVNADTAEGAHLTSDERAQVVAAAREAVGGRLPVISGLICARTSDAVTLASQLRDAGADGLLVFNPPSFLGQPLPTDMVLRYFEPIRGIGLPLIGFNLAADLGGSVLDTGTIKHLIDEGLIDAIKEASFNPVTYIQSRDAVRAAGRPVGFLSGCDNFIHESFLLGADGALLGFAALAARMTVTLLDLVKSHAFDEAAKLNAESVQLLAATLYGPPMRDSRARIKEGLAALGVIDSTVVRPPLMPLSAPDRDAVIAAMRTAGLL
ncbi:dihydrodipicolinate synthase family protein [Phytohabitans flavus]|uniref:Dihydrodipicolinate synthase family protein n=1 Tax=Phytohabitans flavus TaxID=1076124 RepID=A0A6F8XN92_9ACTN|nr:dihydrodipicolinate synthase family protein [Phytohabitans flavus]BCB75295.1 dihydrodipicolinate synthase family protein [Phytohabitans flavus]